MRLIRADHLGMCFGVRDAIALATEEAAVAPLTILGDLVHNRAVLADLDGKGIATAATAADVKTQRVMITAHGASETSLARTRALGLTVVEATCPLVHVAHRAVAQLVAEGYFPVIVGVRTHVEVRGLTEDLDAYAVVFHDQDVLALPSHPKIGVAAQTTQPVSRVEHVTALIRQRFPASDVRLVDTVCRPTKLRQQAAIDLAQRADVVVVVGGAHSNNTRELLSTCAQYCARVHHVESETDLRTAWFAGARIVGITAGTSTLDATIDRVEATIRKVAPEC